MAIDFEKMASTADQSLRDEVAEQNRRDKADKFHELIEPAICYANAYFKSFELACSRAALEFNQHRSPDLLDVCRALTPPAICYGTIIAAARYAGLQVARAEAAADMLPDEAADDMFAPFMLSDIITRQFIASLHEGRDDPDQATDVLYRDAELGLDALANRINDAVRDAQKIQTGANQSHRKPKPDDDDNGGDPVTP